LPEAFAAEWKTLSNKKLCACKVSHQIVQPKEIGMEKQECTKCILNWKLYEKYPKDLNADNDVIYYLNSCFDKQPGLNRQSVSIAPFITTLKNYGLPQ
jgi:hypothetical protein